MLPARLACAAIAAVLMNPAFAGPGDDFGSRDPALCPLRDAPQKGAPSIQQAVHYLACDMEKIGDMGSTMYLLSEVRIKVEAKPRAFDAKTDAVATNIDPGQPVFPISGDFRIYQCGRKSSAEWLADPGKACRYQNFYAHSGLCWKAIGSNWHCAMNYQIMPSRTVHDVAPPRPGSYFAIGADRPPPAGSTSRAKKRKSRHR